MDDKDLLKYYDSVKVNSNIILMKSGLILLRIVMYLKNNYTVTWGLKLLMTTGTLTPLVK